MKITITGSSGFVGQNLSSYFLEQENQVRSLSLRKLDWKSNLDRTSDAIIHLAGKTHDTTNTSNPNEYFKINRDLTIELFNEFVESEIQSFFYFSTVKAVADTVNGVLTEDVVPNPITPYGISKLEAENFLLNQNLPLGKRLFIIRPCMIHGEGNIGNLNLLYKIVEKRIPWVLANYENKRSFISIDNLNFLIYRILENPYVSSGVYNFADDEFLSTNELISVMNNISGKNPKFWKVPKKLIEQIASLGNKIHLPLNTERLKKLTESYIVSNQKIKTELGIKSLPLTAEEGLIKTIKSFKNK